MWTAVRVKPGERVRCGHARSGARCYLCVNGGIDVPLVLDSASTHLLTAMGGLEGRALKRGDILQTEWGRPTACAGLPVPLRPQKVFA